MIRKATETDAASCSAILHEWIAETPWFPNHAPESASEQSMLERIRAGRVIVLVSGDRINGFAAYKGDYLDCLYLTPEARNKGYGKALLDEAKQNCPSGLALWVLAQNERAVSFYTREGFSITARGDGSDNEENLPDIRMEWHPQEGTHG